ncbi:uncharacterized protein LOC131155917 [Malania oleifera]|uniref:uncharacterized protein LOC131155917 n=1 Tax=Malania oleifera TaxID=397392 RepID=UPI0025AE4836|nr:uncharacterized protein LOC131155917 [Malania oleifera]
MQKTGAGKKVGALVTVHLSPPHHSLTSLARSFSSFPSRAESHLTTPTLSLLFPHSPLSTIVLHPSSSSIPELHLTTANHQPMSPSADPSATTLSQLQQTQIGAIKPLHPLRQLHHPLRRHQQQNSGTSRVLGRLAAVAGTPPTNHQLRRLLSVLTHPSNHHRLLSSAPATSLVD